MTNGNALLAELDSTLSSRSPDRSAETLRRVADLFLNGGRYSDQQLSLFDNVFCRLVAKIESRALVELSDRLAAAEMAPAGIIRRLASDNAIEIAGPVLTQSRMLTDEDLSEIARAKGQDHLLAVSGRECISSAVTDILIERGGSSVMRSLAGNAGATISDHGYSRLIDKAKDDEVLGEIIASRNDISLPGLRRLLIRATKEACVRLLQKVKPEFKKDVHETLLRIFDRVDNNIHLQRDSAVHEIQALHDRGQLDAKVVHEFCKAGKLAQTTAGLSKLAATSFELVADILDSGQNHPLMVACKAAGFHWSITYLILKFRPHQHDIVEFQFDRLLFDYCRLSQGAARRVLSLWDSKLSTKTPDDVPLGEAERPVRKPRAYPRSKTHQAAIILGPNNFEKRCTMLDISRGGAKLQIASAVEVPDRFVLTLARNRLIRRNCTVVWRAAGHPEKTFGVSFD